MRVSKSALALAMLFSAAAPVALAQDQAQDQADDGGIGEVIVTAQRREQALQDVPIAVSSLSAATLEQRGVTSMANFNTGTVPGLVVFKSAGIATQLGINIRGVTVSDPGQGTVEQGVPVYIDGVYLGRSQGLGMDLIEPQRIEVLRGPQGTLFGRNAEGGAVQIISAPPSGDFGVNLNATVGNYNHQRFVGHIDLPEFNNLSIRLSGLYSGHDGYVENGPHDPNISAQEDFGLEDNHGVRVAARWRPANSFILDYAYDNSVSEYTSQYFQYADRGGAPIGGRQVDEGRVDTAWTTLWLDRLRTEAEGHTLTATWDWNEDITLRSITAYRTLEDGGYNQTAAANSFTAQAGVAIPGHPGLLSYGRTGLAAGAFLDQKQFSQEFQLIGSAPRLDYTLGVFHYAEDVSDTRITGATLYYTAPGPSAPTAVDPIIIAGPNVNLVENRSYAIYGQATWTPPVLDDRLELTLGLRYTDDDKTARRTISNGATLVTPLQSDFEAQRVDPAVMVQYNFTDDMQAYLRYATGYRSGGVAVRSATFRSYEEEVAETWELGFKANFGRQARVGIALFQNEIDGLQVNTLSDPLVNISLVDTINIPVPYTLRGIEFESEWAPTDNLRFGFSYAYTDEEDPSYSVGGVPVPLMYPGVPEHMGSVSVDYEVPLSFASLNLHADYQASTDYYRPNVATALTAARFYPSSLDMLNGRVTLAGIEANGATFDIALWGRNLTDSEDIVFSSTAGGVVLNDPRTYGLSVRYRY